ncbi:MULTISPECIES: c-type cytochrome [Hyphomicrobiales]|jgi:thiosulfate dehydrogenase|uniref:Thiosulfate dehydrogenase n=1 Tax=Shinella granuli TaxID=323621 RepID=A0A4R2CB16_SHIGR|nr:c-type cytochrome [Shinella granuli]OYX68409.1 MAG: cytochrome C [Rhizobiales bacterium 32-66-11]TCN35944.1 thiosulfate dehydrogenase [Shinella granuli]
MNKRSLTLTGAAIVAVAATAGAFAFLHEPTLDAPAVDAIAVLDANGKRIGDYRIPADNTIAAEPNADAIRLGQRLLNETARLLPANVGNGLNCNSCHMAQGKLSDANPYINTTNSYPSFNPRANREVDLTMRINGCFQRSMNGKPLGTDSTEMHAMLAYMDWLRQGVAKGDKTAVRNAGPIDESLVPDPERGRTIYAAQCASCHGAHGQGMKDQAGDYIFPPLWGDESLNIGAGLARTYKAAQFVKYAMPPAMHLEAPLGAGGVLSDQDAVDVAEFFTHMPRPDFAGKVNDWKGVKKPKDARY